MFTTAAFVSRYTEDERGSVCEVVCIDVGIAISSSAGIDSRSRSRSRDVRFSGNPRRRYDSPSMYASRSKSPTIAPDGTSSPANEIPMSRVPAQVISLAVLRSPAHLTIPCCANLCLIPALLAPSTAIFPPLVICISSPATSMDSDGVFDPSDLVRPHAISSLRTPLVLMLPRLILLRIWRRGLMRL